MIDACRQKLRSDAALVVVEAAAGCGKTYQAVEAALDLCAGLQRGREVLFLAHTNAAVRVFRERTAGCRVPIRATTLDAFALELVRPYAGPLDLPVPLRVDCANGVDFAMLAPKLTVPNDN